MMIVFCVCCHRCLIRFAVFTIFWLLLVTGGRKKNSIFFNSLGFAAEFIKFCQKKKLCQFNREWKKKQRKDKQMLSTTTIKRRKGEGKQKKNWIEFFFQIWIIILLLLPNTRISHYMITMTTTTDVPHPSFPIVTGVWFRWAKNINWT